ncbi:unnamed protein product [Paramecium octaurelia]|uniref:Uncharacterized protein n=1 Tax=Paramecium octaurelia TaxID=43137 RepID=A0A8S1Y7Q7_PAROT|nr:unnamed protein product [Paramecium octaurelia]
MRKTKICLGFQHQPNNLRNHSFESSLRFRKERKFKTLQNFFSQIKFIVKSNKNYFRQLHYWTRYRGQMLEYVLNKFIYHDFNKQNYSQEEYQGIKFFLI